MASADPPAPGESGASGTTKKMGSSSLWVPGPALSLLLLLFLLLPPPLLSTGSFLHRLPAWRPFHQGTRHYRRKIEKPKTCEGAFDLYLIVDTSDNANSIWKDIYKFVDDLVKRFPNSKMRMSLITYSTQSDTIMNLTSDRTKIHNSLEKIQNIVPTGAANMHEGFKKANEQIEKAIYGGNNAPSLIIGLTAGPLTPRTFEETKSEAEKARERGAKVYSVGVKDYKNDQLKDIVERNDQFYGVNSGFESLEDIVNMLVVNSCHEIMAGESYFVCVGEEYDMRFYDPDLHQHTMDEFVCRYKLDVDNILHKKPLLKDDESLACPGHVFKEPGQVVIVQYSLNNGVTFIEESMKVTSLNCGNTSEPTDAPKEETSVPTVGTQKTTVPTVVTQEAPAPMDVTEKPTLDYLFPLFVPTLIIIVVVICCLCCCRKPCKELPVQKIVMKPETCIQTRTPVIVPSCMYQEDTIRRIEGKLDTLCDFVQSCNQIPLMWCQPRNAGKYIIFNFVNPLCGQLPYSPNICLPPSQECFPLNSCCSQCQHPSFICSQPPSRMLSLLPPPAHALSRTTLSLPPP
ncbi:anthrax toxin receptor-like [Neofelis nebulosa]|uniref:anthrax toxin receptor-like n=1 Tax=Neofelis nebulosa TaxID=61452 RepID=UPI00272B850D|nr:anthrax toxin receptor-like [Neofelis nebulosa]